MTNILKAFENKQLKTTEMPVCHPGDTLEIKIQIQEGTRTRFQTFAGVLIANRNKGVNSSLTLRKISYGEGVERTFMIHSPLVKEIKILKWGKVRQARLYYLRDRTAKQARIKEKIPSKKKSEPKAKKAKKLSKDSE